MDSRICFRYIWMFFIYCNLVIENEIGNIRNRGVLGSCVVKGIPCHEKKSNEKMKNLKERFANLIEKPDRVGFRNFIQNNFGELDSISNIKQGNSIHDCSIFRNKSRESE